MKQVESFRVALLLTGLLSAQAGVVPAWASSSDRKDVTRWNLSDGAVARLGKGHVGSTDRAVAYSPDGARLAVAASIGIWIYDAGAGDEVALLTGHSEYVNSVAFSPDGTMLASGSADNTIRL